MTRNQEAAIYRNLRSMPEVREAMLIRRYAHGPEEMWLFVVAQGSPAGNELETKIRHFLQGLHDIPGTAWRVLPLTQLPLSRHGRVMRRAVERFVNDRILPNRSRFANPEVLMEISAFLEPNVGRGVM